MVHTKEHIETKLNREQTDWLTWAFSGCQDVNEEDYYLREFGVTVNEYLDACEMYGLMPVWNVFMRCI